jgi:hypothetical protein
MDHIIIKQFRNISYIKDKKGRILTFQSRYASCFIITLKGRLKFTFDDKTVITDCNQGVFIPEGTAYTNECLESAESISVNFDIFDPSVLPVALNGMNEKLAMSFYREISQKACENTESAQYYLLSRLYRLADLLFQNDSSQNLWCLKRKMTFEAENYRKSLAPRWLTAGPYAVLTTVRTQKRLLLPFTNPHYTIV